MRHAARITIASILGNALEFYNLTLYGALTPVFAALYFPAKTPALSLLISLLAFGVSFFVRPLGAILFGHIGDKIGRKKALTLSILFMGIPTTAIAFLPVYEEIGIWAPIALILCRFLQGICAGGEFNGATIFALEHLGKKQPGFVGGAIVGSCLLGSLFASIIVSFLTTDIFPGWAWRGAFLLGGLFSLGGLYLRREIDESPIFKEIQKKDQIVPSPLKTALVTHWRSCLFVLAIAAFDGALTYTLVSFLNVYLVNTLNHSVSNATFNGFFGMLACMLGCPFFGYYADKYGAKETLVVACFLILGLTVPAFMAITSTPEFSVLGGHILLGLLVASIIGVQPLFSQALFPAQDRYTGISFSYSVGVGIMGGLTPFLLTASMQTSTNNEVFLIPSLYLMTFSAIFLGILLLLPARK
ncbi:MAG: MFS transporter [Alphaproteobacteria bacterium]